MKNILDYVKETKDVSFKDEPFNEVDGLILAELVYIDFDGLLDEESNVSLVDANNSFWSQHTEEEFEEITSHSKWAPFMMKDMVESVRFKDIRLKNYVTDISLKDIKQFGAVTFELPDGSDYISYRGTNKTVAGWMEDFKFSFSTTEGQADAVSYINKYQISGSRPIRIGGHSKGGNIAVYAGIFCERSIQDRILNVYSYDGPGFKMDILESEEYNRILPRVLAVIPKDCMVGIMMNNRYKTIIAESEERIIKQHNAYQWHIDGFRFEEAEARSEWSVFYEKQLNLWLTRCDESKRERILDILFTLITENELAQENTVLNPEFVHIVLSNASKLSKEDRALLISSLSDVFASTTAVTSDEIKLRSSIIADEMKTKSAPVAEDLKEKSATIVEEFKEKSAAFVEDFKENSSEFVEGLKEKSAAVVEDFKEGSANLIEKITSMKKNDDEEAEEESEDNSEDDTEE